jgi:hypothetical protein
MQLTKRYAWRRWIFPMACTLLICGAAIADELQLLWQIAPEDQPFMTTGNTERGIAYNPATDHVLLVSRATGEIHILDAENGTELGLMNLGAGIISGGTFPMSMIGVSDDGVIYVANLSTSTTVPNLKIYRWQSETAEEPTIAFEGDPAGTNDEGASNNEQRWGDSIDVRGSGASTEILLGSNAGTVAALLTTADGETFSSKLISNASVAGALGVAFGTGNTIWTRKGGATPQPLVHVEFDPATGEGTVLHSFTPAQLPGAMSAIAVNTARNVLAGVAVEVPASAQADSLVLYDISNLSAAPTLIDSESFPADNPNGNYVGSADFHDDVVFALDTNNGLVAYRLVETVTPPTFAAPFLPASLQVLEGGYATLTPTVSGTAPYDYFWFKESEPVTGMVGGVLRFTNVTPAAAGSYTLIVSNVAGTITNVTTVTTLPSTRSSRAAELWKLAPGSRPYLVEGVNERGIAYNPLNGHVLIVSRSGGLNVQVLDGATGADLHKLQVPAEVVTGGTFPLNMIGVADDGAVYAANLVTDGNNFKIYRWADDSATTVPTVAYAGEDGSGLRLGDTFHARGTGAETQLLAAHNETTGAEQPEPPASFIIYTTLDGENFTANRFDLADAPAGSSRLGATFGEGDTIYAKAPGHPLRQFAFDLGTLTGSLLHAYDNVNLASIGPIGYDPATKLLGGIANFDPVPNNVELYQFTEPGTNPTLVDQDFLPTDNRNANGTGSIDFGGGNMYVLDTGNGVLALKINPVGPQPDAPSLSNASMSAGTLGFTLTGTANSGYKIEATSDFATWTEVTTVTTGANGSVEVTDSPTQPYRFYRAVAQ